MDDDIIYDDEFEEIEEDFGCDCDLDEGCDYNECECTCHID